MTPPDLIDLTVRTLEQYRTASVCKPRPGEEDTFAEAIALVKQVPEIVAENERLREDRDRWRRDCYEAREALLELRND